MNWWWWAMGDQKAQHQNQDKLLKFTAGSVIFPAQAPALGDGAILNM
jgi:hypothetical protein